MDALDFADMIGSEIDRVIACEACTYADRGVRYLQDREVLVTRWCGDDFVVAYTLGGC
mgnify:CR=1 FL=1